MSDHILNRPVTRGKLWGQPHTWAEAIQNHAEHAHSGCCRFIVTDAGIWMEGDGGRTKVFRTKLPKGAEDHARACIASQNLVPSTRDPRLRVGPRYA